MNILFVCKYNRFRSKIAEAYFNKINKNRKLKAKSAGLIIGSPIAKSVKIIAKRNNLNIKGKPKGLTTNLLIWQDLIVIVADDIPKSIFNNEDFGKKTIIYKIPDTNSNNLKEIENSKINNEKS